MRGMRRELAILTLSVWALGGCGGAPRASRGGPTIEWRHDDYAGAVAAAKAAGKPLVIDFWAPWCHTCLSMKHTVLVDPGLAPLADRFVWVALDTDEPGSAAALKKLPIAFWPTFFVIDPHDESVQARHVGAASLEQFRAFLRRGERGFLDARASDGALAADDPLRHVRDAERAALAGDAKAADAAFARAFARAPDDWARAPEVLVAWIGARYAAGDHAGCLALAEERLDHAVRGHTAAAADFVYYAGACAARVGGERARALRVRAAAALETVVADAAAPLAVDDRSEALRILRELYLALGDEAAARRRAEAQRDLLAKAAAEAPTPLAAMTYNWPRAEVHVFLGEGEALVPELRRSAEALPDQYDPPYRLAWLLLKLGRPDEALPPAERAAALAYGPRKGRILSLLADVHAARGDIAARRAALEAWVAHERALPDGQRDAERLARAEAALAAAVDSFTGSE